MCASVGRLTVVEACAGAGTASYCLQLGKKGDGKLQIKVMSFFQGLFDHIVTEEKHIKVKGTRHRAT